MSCCTPCVNQLPTPRYVTRTWAGVFLLGYVFQRGDLPIFILDDTGNLTDPVELTFTIFKVLMTVSGPSPVLVEREGRQPVRAGVGEYYVTDRAGRPLGPGDYIVRWRWRINSGDPLQEENLPFKVFDSSVMCAGHVPPCIPKCGW